MKARLKPVRKPARPPARQQPVPPQPRPAAPERAPGAGENGGFAHLVEYLERTRGFSFSAYKDTGLRRRIKGRMDQLQIDKFPDYVDYLEVHPDEFQNLFNRILINLTGFFRDRTAWDYVAAEIIPRIAQSNPDPMPIRVWTAGCASGEEAYTLAMLFAEAIGIEQLRDRIKIYGTDVDEEAINQARQGFYSAKQVGDVPPELLKKYFDGNGSRLAVNKDLRRAVIFGRHDLVRDAPISRVDLIVCRNTLMYFNAEAQAKVLANFAFALNDGGFLFLGKAETMLLPSRAFTPVDIKRRVFTKTARVFPIRERLAATPGAWANGNLNGNPTAARLRDTALDVDPVPQIVLDPGGALAFANEAARTFLGVGPNDLGRPLQELPLASRGLQLDALVEQASLERHTTNLHEIEWPTPGWNTPRFVDLTVMPLFDASGTILGTKILISDATRQKHLQEELRHSHQELETAYEELQSANEELQTTNEELQSANEELETTNEELQSTNEELETMNEELQSANTELMTTNEQLRVLSDELGTANLFNDSILASLNDAVIGVDQELRVTAWNRRAYELWGLKGEDVKGKYLMSLDIGLEIDPLRGALRSILSGESELASVAVDATNRRGKPIRVQVTATRLGPPGGPPLGAILLMQEKRREEKPGK